MKELAKQSLIALAKQHKISCEHSNCPVSLMSIRLLAEDAGVVFTKEEMQYFI